MRRILTFALSTIVATVIWTANPAGATVVFNTFGPGDSFFFGGPAILGSVFGTNIYAARFTPSADGTLSDIDLALSGAIGVSTSLIVTLRSDAAGLPAASALETFTIGGVTGGFLKYSTGDGSGTTVLDDALNYWVVVAPGASNTLGGWANTSPAVNGFTNQGNTGTTWFFPAPGTFGQTVAFRVEVTDAPVGVPEPATIGLVGLGLAALGVLRRRR